MIPGLWVLHTHNFDLTGGIDYVRQFPLLVANGVTGVREIGASGRPLEELVRLREEVLSGRLTGPRVVMAGPVVDGPVRRVVCCLEPVADLVQCLARSDRNAWSTWPAGTTSRWPSGCRSGCC